METCKKYSNFYNLTGHLHMQMDKALNKLASGNKLDETICLVLNIFSYAMLFSSAI